MTRLTCDGFLDGRLNILQPAAGYRAGVDAVLLAAFVRARAGHSVLELGCGVGVASLCLGKRVAGLRQTGLEVQPEYADIARRNADENDISLEVVDGDLAAMPDTLRQRQFDRVLVNPPYFDRASSVSGPLPARERSMGEQVPLSVWVDQATRRLRQGGWVSFIHRAERLPELLSLMSQGLGSLEVVPLVPRLNRPAELVLVRGRKSGRAAFRLHSGIVLHEGDRHERDGENYTPIIRSVLRDGKPLPT